MPVMMDRVTIPELRLKFAEKSWADTFQLVRRCMEKSRDESRSRKPLERSLEKLQEESNVCTINTTKLRLEIIAKQQGMSFHFAEATCYLSADLFYVEVLLLPCGEVEEVKVVPHGESPVPSESLLQLLRSKNFAAFSLKLQGLFAQYNIPGDNEIKFKLLASLQCLGKDLWKIAHLPREQKYFDPEMDLINNGRIGDLSMGKEDVDLQWAPLPKLLMRDSLSANSSWEMTCESNMIFTVTLPGGVMHSYVFPGAAWDVPAHRGAVVDSVPFTHPGHVPALLELLRHQCAINTLLRSCFIFHCASPGSVCGLHFEVLPESESSFSVTFQPPDADSLGVLLVNVPKPHQITCSLFGANTRDPSINEYLSSVIMSCMSIPETMRMLYNKLEDITSVPLSPSCSATTETENDHSAPSSTAVADTSRALATFSQSAAMPKDGFSVSDLTRSALTVAKSESILEIN
ncbi:mediator of RNA polymerase II transcription subunit 1 isoform X3 [Haplochromis burtoni]|uniref:mediator of RNA polymerase II transcription subunit 1 isoform X3 n=1 Tax=Haplochromis burtoni TaxID=8153 RepID=UPI0003BD46C4|nr:mediator of RNA polymerase II transcription subunit 1 isoform X3 [Haplochromis burtoni]